MKASVLLAVTTTALVICARGDPARDYCVDPQDPLCHDDYTFPHSNPQEDWNKKGISAASKGDLKRGCQLFRAAALHSAFRGDVWANLGLCLTDLSRGQLPTAGAPARGKIMARLREAIAATQLGIYLKNKPAISLNSKALSLFREEFPGKCEAAQCERSRAEKKAMEMVNNGNHLEAANSLCSDPAQFMTVLSKAAVRMEREGGDWSERVVSPGGEAGSVSFSCWATELIPHVFWFLSIGGLFAPLNDE